MRPLRTTWPTLEMDGLTRCSDWMFAVAVKLT